MEKIAVPRERNENKELRDAKFSLVQFLDGLAWEPINQFYQGLHSQHSLSNLMRNVRDQLIQNPWFADSAAYNGPLQTPCMEAP